jgi:hypothetical protein
MKAFLRALLEKLKKLAWDAVSDKNDSGDEKRIWGNLSVFLGLAYPFTPDPQAYIMGIYLAFGAVLLGLASWADVIPLAGAGR